MPPDIAWGPPHRVDLSDEAIAIEPLAEHVPEECLYVRFGSWNNQIWLKQFMLSYGEDLSRLIALADTTLALTTVCRLKLASSNRRSRICSAETSWPMSG
ncbi:MAG: hypothetical protein R3B96_09650 [Pirellulaceae bacterium]